jgi:hypothetical protein
MSAARKCSKRICVNPNGIEIRVPGSPRRLNDEWRAMQWQQFPPDVDPARVEGVVPPPWTSGYLVPR